jgi:hypothetical protein
MDKLWGFNHTILGLAIHANGMDDFIILVQLSVHMLCHCFAFTNRIGKASFDANTKPIF